MFSARYLLRLASAFIAKFKFLLVFGILLGILGFIVITRISPRLLRGTVERIGISDRVRADKLPAEIVHLIGQGLTELDSQGVARPALAESWQVSEDGKVWTFRLQETARWQDGKRLVAADIKYLFLDATVEAPNETTIVFRLQNPFSPFPAVVSRPVFKKGLLGTGEWRVANRGLRLAGTFVESMTLVDKNKNKKVFKFYPTEERTKLAFKLGSVDRIENIFNLKSFESWKNVEISQNVNTGQYVAVFFNTRDPILAEKSLRQALAYGADKAKFAGPRAIGPLSPDSWAFNPQVKPYAHDMGRAKVLLKELPKEQRETLAIKLVTTAVLLDTAESIATDWNSLGVKTEVQVVSSVAGDFQALLAIFDIPQDPDQYSIWHSTQTASNISKFSNPRIDKLLEDGRTRLEEPERKKIYFDFQRFLVEESPAVFLYHPITFTVTRK